MGGEGDQETVANVQRPLGHGSRHSDDWDGMMHVIIKLIKLEKLS